MLFAAFRNRFDLSSILNRFKKSKEWIVNLFFTVLVCFLLVGHFDFFGVPVREPCWRNPVKVRKAETVNHGSLPFCFRYPSVMLVFQRVRDFPRI